MVMCCFSGEWIKRELAIEVVLFFPQSNETQQLFAKASELRRLIVPQVPIHPDLIDLAN